MFELAPGTLNYVRGTFKHIATPDIMPPGVAAGECHDALMVLGGVCTKVRDDFTYPEDEEDEPI